MWPFGKRTEGETAQSEPELECSFCGKRQDEVARIIAGPKVYICDECVDLCNDIIAQDASSADERPVPQRPIVPSGLHCALCRFPVEVGAFVAVPDRGALCPACLDAIRAASDDDESEGANA